MAYLLFILLFSLADLNLLTISEPVVKINVPGIIVHAGKGSVIIINVEVKKGYHIQANKVNNEFLIPTTLEIITGKKIQQGEHSFPEAKKFKLEGTNDFLDVYDGSFQISIPFKTQWGIQKGKYYLHAKVRYQACDFKSCLFPKTIDFVILLTII